MADDEDAVSPEPSVLWWFKGADDKSGSFSFGVGNLVE